MPIRHPIFLAASLVLCSHLVDAIEGESGEGAYFNSVVDKTELHGCWKRVIRPDDLRLPQKIQLYPFDEPENQWFCFLEDNELFTKFSTVPDEPTLDDLVESSKIFPSVEKYRVIQSGLVQIDYLDAGQKTVWVTRSGLKIASTG